MLLALCCGLYVVVWWVEKGVGIWSVDIEQSET